MQDMLYDPGMLVYAAGFCYVLGLLIINQIFLRLMILGGTALYVLYYSIVAAEPLWEAIYISVLIGLANLIGFAGLLMRRSTLILPRAHRDIYAHFRNVPPGDFRKLMSLAKRHRTDSALRLTDEAAPLDQLYYVVRGETEVSRGGKDFVVAEGAFVGEVAFLTGKPASARATLRPGGEYLQWSQGDLRRACERSVRFQMALDAVLSIDLAHKVARSVASDEPPWQAGQRPTAQATAPPI